MISDKKLIWQGPLHEFGGNRNYILHCSIHHGRNTMEITYQLQGDVSSLEGIVPKKDSHFCDNLWQTTCFEFFLRGHENSYIEWNLSCSGQWACYQFSRYRQKIGNKTQFPPSIQHGIAGHQLEFAVSLPIFTALEPKAGHTFQPATILKPDEGKALYFAAQHSREAADFHDAAVFLPFPPEVASP